MKKYIPQEYRAAALDRTKRELAAFEDRLKEAKQKDENATKGKKDETAGTDLLAQSSVGQPADDYSKYHQHGVSSGGNSASDDDTPAGSRTGLHWSQYVKTYAPAYAH